MVVWLTEGKMHISEDSNIFEKHQTCLCSQYPNQDGTMDHTDIVKKASVTFRFFPLTLTSVATVQLGFVFDQFYLFES